ncbi:hypothetical protein WICANDRAFT_33631, partial [Wickerhamomyces anomalus NRRL Y-366-8]
GFAPIEAIFYSVFHPTEGTKVSQQVPLGAIVTPPKSTSDVLAEPLFDFDLVKNYVIPKAQLCNRLVTLKVNQYRIIGYPVTIIAPHYARNSFSFNFCFVFRYESDTTPYESAIRRLGRMFKNLEEQYQLLSRKEKDRLYFKDDGRNASTNTAITSPPMTESFNNDTSYTIKLDSIESLIQQIYQDLNNYSECLIPIDSGNSVDIKLFPLLPPPPRLNQEDVPISTVHLESMVDVNWDPTMLKILPFINGINSIKKISVLANSDYNIVKQCIQHLIYYKCIIIIDIFQFSNIYAPTSDIVLFLKDSHMATECQAYVVSPSIFKDKPFESDKSADQKTSTRTTKTPNRKSSGKDVSSVSLVGDSNRSKRETVVLPSKAKLYFLYRSLHQGQTVKSWYKEHAEALEHIDIRRFLSFGVLRGLIYRVHSYPIIDSVLLKEEHSQSKSLFLQAYNDKDLDEDNEDDEGEGTNETDAVTNLQTVKAASLFKRNTDNELSEADKRKTAIILKNLNDIKNFDAVCTELEMDRKSVETLLRKIGHFNVVNS